MLDTLAEIQAAKKLQRAQCTQARRQLSPEERKEKSACIVQKLMEIPELQHARIIFSYLSTPDEVDLSFLHEELIRGETRIAFPVSHKGGIMDARIPFTPADMIRGKFGIREPDISRSTLAVPEEIDVILVPCVGFDCEGRRLGHGGGYYDRYLCQCPDARLICVGFDVQELPSVVTEETDQPMDIIVTESRILHRSVFGNCS